MLIVGPCGTGKSHLAQALGHCAVRQGVDVVFTTCASLTQSLNAARAIGAYERKLAALARVPLLIIDDFGLKPLRPPADEDLHDLIAERYEQTTTIVTSNLDFSEWDQAFPANRLLASATLDRCDTTPTAWCSTGSRTARRSWLRSRRSHVRLRRLQNPAILEPPRDARLLLNHWPVYAGNGWPDYGER